MERVIAYGHLLYKEQKSFEKGLEEYTSIRVIYGEAEAIEWKIP